MTDWTERCTIGITTRDRAEDLRHALQRQGAIGLDAMRYIIIDDGSANPDAVRLLAERLPRCRFVRHEHSAGYILRRQQMAEMCETEFLISLDDDSYFLNFSGMESVLQEFDRDPKAGLASFKIIELSLSEPRVCKKTTQFPRGNLYWFRGCGYMVRVAAFLAAGGFPAEFRYGCEESHMLHQFFRLGIKVFHAPDVVVEHRWSSRARDYREWAFNWSRSQVLLKMYNQPWLPVLAGVAKLALLDSLRVSCKHGFLGARLMGTLSGVRLGLRRRRNFTPLSLREYREFRREVRRSNVPELVEIG